MVAGRDDCRREERMTSERMAWTRREVLRFFGAGTAVAVAGASWRGGAEAAPATAQDCPAAATPQAGGTITVGQIQDLTGFDPFVLLFANYAVMHQVFDRLIAMDHQLQANPSLAESWTIAE